jgi:sugar lactone lactonase YvrE
MALDVAHRAGCAVLAGLALATMPWRAGAQALPAWPKATAAATGIAAVDSAAVARAAWQRVNKLVESGDLAGARREVDRAAAAWPSQPSYAWGRAVVAAWQDDTAAVRASLASYAALGLGRDLRAHPVLGEYATVPAMADVVVRLDANRRPMVGSEEVATVADSTFWPEGMDADPRTGRYWIASVRRRTVAEVGPGRAHRLLWPADGETMGAVLGVRFDAARDVLWVTTSHVDMARTDGKVTDAALLRVRRADGRIERRWTLPASARGHVLGDLALGPAGDVWVTDSNDPALYRLRPGADSLERIDHPLLHSPQGVVATPDGRAVYVADYSHGLLRVDVATGAVTRLDDAPGTTSLGCDGIAWDRGAIVAVQNGVLPARIVRFTLDSTGARIARVHVLDRNTTVADEPTIGAVLGRTFVYVANSAWEKYRADGSRAPNTRLAPPVLLAVPLESLAP